MGGRKRKQNSSKRKILKSRKYRQRGGLLLRKNRSKKLNEIRNFTITDEGIRWCGGLKTQFKKLFGKGSCGQILYSDMIKPPAIDEDNTEILISMRRGPTHYKIYRLDNQWVPATNLPKPPESVEVYKFYFDIGRGYRNVQSRMIDERLAEAEDRISHRIRQLDMTTGGKHKRRTRKIRRTRRRKNKNRRHSRRKIRSHRRRR